MNPGTQDHSENPAKRSYWRFSLRSLLFVLLIFGAASYLLVRPDFVAAKFVNHINDRDLDSAQKMFQWKTDFSHYWDMLKEQNDEPDREIFAHWKRPTFSNLIRFEREITVESNTKGLGMSSQVRFKSTPTHVTLRPKI